MQFIINIMLAKADTLKNIHTREFAARHGENACFKKKFILYITDKIDGNS